MKPKFSIMNIYKEWKKVNLIVLLFFLSAVFQETMDVAKLQQQPGVAHGQTAATPGRWKKNKQTSTSKGKPS